jgi:hypothetical protein
MGVQGPMATTNKCLAENNKSRHVIRATKDTNGHPTVGTPSTVLISETPKKGPSQMTIETQWAPQQPGASAPASPTPATEKKTDLTNILAVAAVLFFPVMSVLNGARAEIAMFGTVVFSGPILLGIMAQRTRGRTGAAWWLLSTIAVLVANLIGGGGSTPEALSYTILLGIAPMAIIIWSLPRRK